jgi:cell division protein FtsB
MQVPSTEQRDLLERGRKEVNSCSQGSRYFFISISFKHSLRKVESFIILVILVFELAHVRFLYGFLNKGVAVVRLMFRTTID